MLKAMFKFLFLSDGGHGWLRVPLAVIREETPELIEKITKYSYMNSRYAYLEEDQDAPLFLNALKEKGITTTHKVRFSDHSAVRTYNRYTPYFVHNLIEDGTQVSYNGRNMVLRRLNNGLHLMSERLDTNNKIIKFNIGRLPKGKELDYISPPVDK